MRRLLLLLAGIPLLLLTLLIGGQLSARWGHDRRLEQLEQVFAKLQHPPGSRELAFESELGLLQGNGNHCDYFVGALRAGVPPITYAEPGVEITLLEDARDLEWFPLPPRDRLLEEGKRQTVARPEVLYVVSLFDQTAPGNDFRCH